MTGRFQDVDDINKQKAKQRKYYDRQGKLLKPLRGGDAVLPASGHLQYAQGI